MGFFSWKTQDTNKSIANKYSDRETFEVIMTDNNGNKWTESNYEGYGVFGGKDYYELLAEMNGKKTREDGINLSSKKSILHPNLNESSELDWKNNKPNNCKFQGYFY